MINVIYFKDRFKVKKDHKEFHVYQLEKWFGDQSVASRIQLCMNAFNVFGQASRFPTISGGAIIDVQNGLFLHRIDTANSFDFLQKNLLKWRIWILYG